MAKPSHLIVLIRHAHRDTANREADNGLSETGRKQAKHLAQDLSSRLPDGHLTFLSSPKMRCIETLEPLAGLMGKKVKTDALLIEESPHESTSEFIGRIQTFIRNWKEQAPGITIVCSHGDWLPEAFRLLTGKDATFKKAGWVILSHQSDKIEIQESSENWNN